MLGFGEATAGKINMAPIQRAHSLEEETTSTQKTSHGVMSTEIREARVWASMRGIQSWLDEGQGLSSRTEKGVQLVLGEEECQYMLGSEATVKRKGSSLGLGGGH